jgi:hypothetical protein
MGGNQGLLKVQNGKGASQTKKHKERNKFDAEYGKLGSRQVVLECRDINKDKFSR